MAGFHLSPGTPGAWDRASCSGKTREEEARDAVDQGSVVSLLPGNDGGRGLAGPQGLGLLLAASWCRAGFGRGTRDRPRMRALSSAKDTGLLTWERWAQPLDRVNGEEEMVFTEKQS